MTGMDELVTWLSAQLDEDERVARWLLSEVYGIYPDGHTDAGQAFLERFDPARVLAEVDAKRRILDEYEMTHEAAITRAVMILALPYADRDGYQESWRP